MRELTFVESNGSELVLVAGDGEKLTLSIDEELRAAVRLAPSAKLSNEITPREIQDAVRAGASVSEIVNSSGADEDFVEKFATPVLEELAHMVNLALSVRVEVGHDRFNETQFTEFGELITDRLRTAKATGLTWAAHRETPTTWLIKVTFLIEGGEGSATWTFDPRKFTLSPEDTTAISLGSNQGLGDRPIPANLTIHPSHASPSSTEPEEEEATLLDAFRARREAAAAQQPTEDIPAVSELEPTKSNESDEPIEPSEPDEPAAKRGRAPMPTWDEIVFGAKNED